jgi:hypothetical protein
MAGVMLGQQLNRARPALPVHAYQSFEIRRPLPTHWREATCREVGCPHADGWVMRADESTELGRKQAHYIRYSSGRRHRESRDPTGLTVFTFPSGERCFANHMLPTGRPELFVVRGGDWRRSLGTMRRHTRPEHWVEQFAANQDRIATARKRG